MCVSFSLTQAHSHARAHTFTRMENIQSFYDFFSFFSLDNDKIYKMIHTSYIILPWPVVVCVRTLKME